MGESLPYAKTVVSVCMLYSLGLDSVTDVNRTGFCDLDCFTVS